MSCRTSILRMVRNFMVSLIRTSLVNKGFNMNNIVYLRETAVEDMRDKNTKKLRCRYFKEMLKADIS